MVKEKITDELKTDTPISQEVDDILRAVRDSDLPDILRTILNTLKDHEKRLINLEK